MLNAVDVVSSRREFHGSIGPAVYSRRARENIIPEISELPFPDCTISDPLQLAHCASVTKYLSTSFTGAAKEADTLGLTGVRHKFDVYNFGLDDKEFTAVFAGGVGHEVNRQLLDSKLLSEPLSLTDYGKMFQTGWFGEIANQMALTEPAFLQRTLGSDTDGMDLVLALNKAVFNEKNEKIELPDVKDAFEALIDPESGLSVMVLTQAAKASLRMRMDKKNTVGCPVARTSFTVNEQQLAFLKEHDYIGERSGFHEDGPVAARGLMKLAQGPYTAIDDTLWHWGDYVLRYGAHLLSGGEDPRLIAPSTANQVLLLD